MPRARLLFFPPTIVLTAALLAVACSSGPAVTAHDAGAGGGQGGAGAGTGGGQGGADAGAMKPVLCTRPADAGAPTAFVPGDVPPSDGGYVPRLPLLQFGGKVVPLPELVPVTFDGDPERSFVETFVASVGCTSFWRSFSEQYGVGDAITGPPVHLPLSALPGPADAGAGPTLDDAQIVAWIKSLAKSSPGFPAPSVRRVYVIALPQGVASTYLGAVGCTGFEGYHSGAAGVAYLVAPRCGDEKLLAEVLSHELSEAVTDPFPNGPTGYANTTIEDLAWMLPGNSEVADLCDPLHGGHFTPGDFPFSVQRIWSNEAAFAGKNPCVPADAAPWFVAAPVVTDMVGATLQGTVFVGRGKKLAVGDTATIDVQLTAEPGVPGDWTVTAEDWSGPKAQPRLSFSFQGGKSTGHAGDVLKLDITRLAAHPAYGANVFVLRSEQGGADRYWAAMVSD